jgi:hypothetical protein
MKTLEKTFVMNADKCGNHTFTQVRREGNVCLYRRNRLSDGRYSCFEVFITKVVKAGAPLPGGGQVAEDYEQYPGAASFGRTAWSICGVEAVAERRALTIFDELVKGKTKTVEVEETGGEEAETMPVARVVKGEVTLKLPEKPFTQKELAAYNGFDNYKIVYSDLQKMLLNGTLKVVGTREAGRGKPAKLFGKA